MPCINPLHYVDPVMNLTSIRDVIEDQPARPILITGTKRGFELSQLATRNLGEIVKLHDDYKNKFISSSGCAWAVDVNSNHVTGVIGVTQENNSGHVYGEVIFRLDGEWGIGRIQNGVERLYKPFTRNPDLPNRYSVSRPEADPSLKWCVSVTQLGIGDDTHEGEMVYPEVAFPAARWASELFPRPRLTIEEGRKFAEAAELRYEMRRSEIGLQIQSNRRGWGDDPRAKLEEHGVTLPKPTYGREVSGTVNVPVTLSGTQVRAMRDAGIPEGASPIMVEAFNYTFENDEGTDGRRTLHQMIHERVRQDRRESVSGINIDSSSRFISGLAH